MRAVSFLGSLAHHAKLGVYRTPGARLSQTRRAQCDFTVTSHESPVTLLFIHQLQKSG